MLNRSIRRLGSCQSSKKRQAKLENDLQQKKMKLFARKLAGENRGNRPADDWDPSIRSHPKPSPISGSLGFTLVEVLVVMLLAVLLIGAGFSAMYSMDHCSRRLADYTAALTV